MFSFLKSFFGLSFFSTFFISPFIYATSSNSNSQRLRCDAVFHKHAGMISPGLKPRQSIEEFSEDGGDGNASNLKDSFFTEEDSLVLQINKKYEAIKKRHAKFKLELKQIRKDLDGLYEKDNEHDNNRALDAQILKMEKKLHLATTQMSPSEKELFSLAKESLESFGFKVIPRMKPDPEFAKVTILLKQLLEAHRLLERSLKRFNDFMEESNSSDPSYGAMKIVYERPVEKNRQNLEQIESDNKNNPAYQEAVELFEAYKSGDSGITQESLEKTLQRFLKPHLEITEFPNGSAASVILKKFKLKVIVVPSFDDIGTSTDAMGSHLRLHDFSYIWLNLEQMLQYPRSEIFIYEALLHEAGHGAHSHRRTLGLGTDLDLKLYASDDVPLLGPKLGYKNYMSLEEVFTWVKDIHFLTSKYVRQKSQNKKSLLMDIQDKLNGKRKMAERIIEVSLLSLQSARKSIQDGVKIERTRTFKKFYEYSVPVEIEGNSRRLAIQVQGQPASDPSRQNEILLDSIQRSEARVKYLQRQLEGNQKNIVSQEELDGYNSQFIYLLEEIQQMFK